MTRHIPTIYPPNEETNDGIVSLNAKILQNGREVKWARARKVVYPFLATEAIQEGDLNVR